MYELTWALAGAVGMVIIQILAGIYLLHIGLAFRVDHSEGGDA